MFSAAALQAIPLLIDPCCTLSKLTDEGEGVDVGGLGQLAVAQQLGGGVRGGAKVLRGAWAARQEGVGRLQ